MGRKIIIITVSSRINAKVDTISKIVLAKGDPTALVPVSTIAQNVDAKAGSYVWNIPADTPAGEDYALEFGDSPDMSFTGLFTIKSNGNAQSSVAASSSSQPSVDASSSAQPSATSSSSAVVSSPVTSSISASREQETNAQETNVVPSDVVESQASVSASASQTATTNNPPSAGFNLSPNKIAISAAVLAGAAVAALV
jgi:hypothetical protein